MCVHPSHTHPALRHQEEGIWLPFFQTKRKNLQEREENAGEDGRQGVKYACEKLQTRVAAVTQKAAPG